MVVNKLSGLYKRANLFLSENIMLHFNEINDIKGIKNLLNHVYILMNSLLLNNSS